MGLNVTTSTVDPPTGQRGPAGDPSTPFDESGRRTAFGAALPGWSPEIFMASPPDAACPELAPDPQGFRALAGKPVALERGPIASAEEVPRIGAPVLVPVGGVMGGVGAPLSAFRLPVLPGTAHKVAGQPAP